MTTIFNQAGARNSPGELTGDDERPCTDEALALFALVSEMGGAGGVHDREWWAVEAAHRGSDWAGVLNLQSDIVAGIRRAA
jgi:hypothetical protein